MSWHFPGRNRCCPCVAIKKNLAVQSKANTYLCLLLYHRCPKVWPWQQVVLKWCWFIVAVCLLMAGEHRQSRASYALQPTWGRDCVWLRGLVLCTLGIPVQDRATQALEVPTLLSLHTQTYSRGLWGASSWTGKFGAFLQYRAHICKWGGLPSLQTCPPVSEHSNDVYNRGIPLRGFARSVSASTRGEVPYWVVTFLYTSLISSLLDMITKSCGCSDPCKIRSIFSSIPFCMLSPMWLQPVPHVAAARNMPTAVTTCISVLTPQSYCLGPAA